VLKKVPAGEIDWTTPDRPPDVVPPRSHAVLVVLGALGVGLVLGYLGWILPSPGGSIVLPTLIVFGSGGLLVFTASMIALSSAARRWAMMLAVAVGAVTILATVWTWEFALPASIAWSDATSQAQQALATAEHGPKNSLGAPSHPCRMVTTGSIGPLTAPFEVCVLLPFPRSSAVMFSAVGTAGQASRRGIGYVIGASAGWFPDECSRHLEGPWWEFTASNDGLGDCPTGYDYHGGP
jgi:hypothetical protein